MHGIEILLVSVLVAFTQGTNSSLFPNWQSSWIIGGTDAAAGEFPYMASIRRVIGNPPQCGGSIISNWYILTAAHCVAGKLASAIIVVVGTNELNSAGQRYTVSRIIVHDGFHLRIQNYDIALVKLTKPIAYTSTVQPIALSNQDETTAPGTECIFGGWGSTRACEMMVSSKLQKLQVRIAPKIECQKYYTGMRDQMICATAGSGKATGTADSGGPLVCGGRQIGILKGAGTKRIPCPIGLPSLYIRVSKFTNWITQHAV